MITYVIMKRYLLIFTVFFLVAFTTSRGHAQTLFASSTTYCEGSNGVTFGVNNSVAGNSYTLQQLLTSWTDVETITSVAGGTVSFLGQYLSGSYRLKLTVITINITQTNLPENVYNVTGGGGYCSNTVIYPSIGLSGSQTGSSGVIYKLYKDGLFYNNIWAPGTGGPIAFGQFSAPGVYTVKAERNGCLRDMSGSKTITIYTAPTVSFTTTNLLPPNQCGAVSFTPSISYSPPGSVTPYVYNWTFGASSNPISSTSAAPTCQFPAYGTGTQSFPVTLLVTDNNGCHGSSSSNVTVQQRPDATVESQNGFWNNCNAAPNASQIVTIVNKSVTAATNTGYTVNWNDPLAPGVLSFTPAQFPYNGTLTHTYTQKGTFLLTITASGPPTTCVDTKIFPLFNGSTPTGGITYGPGILEGCKPHNITFWLSGDAQYNAPTTFYYFNFGDGSAPLTFTQETMPPLDPDGKYHITHSYNAISCLLPGNSFTLTNYIKNPCDSISNNIGGIKISKKSSSDFLRTEFPSDPIYVCAGVPRVYTNNTDMGCIIYGGQSYNTTTYQWDFFNDGTIESLVKDPTFTFPNPGLYYVKLDSYTGESIPGNCGDSVIIRQVCVQAVPVADFTIPATLCVNTPFIPVNNSTSGPACALPHYAWAVSPNSGYTFVGGTNVNSFQPTFNFTVPGAYAITLILTVNSGLSTCNTVTDQQIIIIKGPPSITVNQPPPITLCGPGNVSMATLVSYNANMGVITDYLWTVSPPTAVISDPTIPFPTITIPGNISQTYTLTVSVANECGTTLSAPVTIDVTQTISNNVITYPPPGLTDVCSGMTISDIVGNVPSGGNGLFTYQWFIDDGSGWTLINGSTGGTLHYTLPLTADPTKFKRRATSGSCTAESNQMVFTIYPAIQNNTISAPLNLCSGATPAIVTGSTPTQGNGTYTYEWQQSTDSPAFVTWVDAPAPFNQVNYTPGALTQTTRYKRIVHSGVCDLASNVVEYTVYPVPAVSSAPMLTICSDVALNYQITSTITGTTYAWTVTDLSGGAITGWNNYPGGAVSIIPDVLTNNSLVNKTIQYTITPTGPAPAFCIGTPFILTVTVRPKITSTYTDQSINVGTSTIITGAVSGGTTAYTYSWAPVNMLLPGESSQANPHTVILNSSQTYTVTVTDGAGCQFVKTITVSTNGLPITVLLTANDPDLKICEGTIITLTATASGGGGGGIPGNYSYVWSGLPGLVTYIQPWIVQFIPANLGGNNYSVVVGDGFTTTMASIVITVNKIPTVTSAVLKQICSGEDVNYTPTADVPGTTFTWVRSTNPCVTAPGANTGTGPISNVLANICNTVESITYTITPTGPAPTLCIGTPLVLTVDVMPVAAITNASNTQAVNAGLPTVAVTFTSNVSGVNFHWQFASVSCPGYFGTYLTSGNTSVIPSQTFTILPGGPPSCQICYTVNAYIILPGGKECWGPSFTYCYTVNLQPATYNLICPAPPCEGSIVSVTLAGSDVGVNYQLYRDGGLLAGSSQPGCNCPIVWNGITSGGTYSVIGTNSSNGVSIPMNNVCVVSYNPNPVANYVLSSTGVCLGDIITLNGSQPNINYELFLNNGSTWEIHPGPGALNFTQTNSPGTYTVRATNILTGCFSWINGSVLITPNPVEYFFDPSGDLCVGDNLNLANSQTGVLYELWCTPFTGPGPVFIKSLAGSGSPISFGSQTIPGTYFVHAIKISTLCDVYFTDHKIFWANPQLFNVTPQPSGIPNCGMTTIGLSSSEPGYHYWVYQLDAFGAPLGFPYPFFTEKIGTGSALVFGSTDDPGEYVVIAWNPANLCQSRMNGSVIIHLNPTKYQMDPIGGPLCVDQGVGQEIKLLNSDAGINYTLNPVGVIKAGGAVPLSFGVQTQPGTYTVSAVNPLSGCTSQMLGSLDLELNPTQFTMYPPTDFCPGEYDIWISGSQLNVTYTLHTPNTAPIAKVGTSGPLHWGYLYYPGTYYIVAEYTASSTCSIVLGTVHINPRPNVFQIKFQAGACEQAVIGLNGSQAGATYELLHADGSSLTPPVFNPPAITPPASFYFASAQPAGSYVVKATNQFGCDTVMNGTAVVFPLPVPTISGPAPVCVGVPGQVYITESGMTNYNWLISSGGLVTAGGTATSNSVTITWNTVGTHTVSVNYLNGNACTALTATVLNVTVNPAGQVNDPPDQMLCNGIMTLPVVFTTTNPGTTTYTWTNDQSSIGLASSGSGDIGSFAAINTGSSPVIATITVTPNSSSGGITCAGIPQSFTISVTPTAQVNDPADQILCNGDITTPVIFSTNNTGGTTTYSWSNDHPSIGLALSGTGNIPGFAATNPGSSPVVATIVVTPHFSYGGITCNGPTQSFTITVNPGGQVNDPPDQVLCNTQMTTPVAFSTGNTGGTTTYSWTNDQPGIGLAAAGTGDIASFAALNPGIAPVTATISVTPHYANGGITCNGTAQSFTITVNPTGQVNDPVDQVLCNGEQSAAVIFGTNNTGGATTYSWTNSNTSIGLASNGTGNISAFVVANPGTSPVVANLTVTPHFTNAGITCVGPAQAFSITVNPTGQVNNTPNQVLCNGGLTTAIFFTTTNTAGTTTYSWTNSATSIGLASSGTGDILAFNAFNTGTAPVIATIVVTPQYTIGGKTCGGPAQSFTITVNPAGQVNLPPSQVLCNGDLATAVIFSTNNSGGTTTYTWTNTASPIGIVAAGTGNIAAFTATNTGTSPIIASIAVTPHFSNGGIACIGTTQTFTITVNPTAQVTDPPDQVLCNGDLTIPVNFNTNNTGGTTTYTWINSTTGIGLAANGTGNIPAFVAANAGTSPDIATIVVTPHFTNAGITCSGPTQTFTITVNPGAQVNDPPDQILCNGAMTAPVVFTTTNGGGTTYNWTNDHPSIGLGASGSGNIASFAAINAGGSPVVATITVTPQFSGGGINCTGPAQSFTITVNPTGQVNDPPDQTLCNGDITAPVTFTTSNTGGTTTYTWTNDHPSIGLASPGSGNIAAFTAINTGSVPIVATIIVTPHFANGGVPCDGPSQSFTMTVNPGGQVNDPADQILCNGNQTTAVNFSTVNTGGATTYSWTNDQASIGLASNGNGDIAAFTAVNTGNAPVVATIVVTPHYSNGSIVCSGASQSYTYTVNPTGQVNDPASQVLCNGDQSAAVIFTTSNSGGTTTYSWVNTNTGIGLAASGTGDISMFVVTNPGISPVVASITVTPHFTNAGITCDGPLKSFTITVNPTGQVNDPPDQVLCNGDLTAAVIFSTNNTSGTTTYSWTNSNTSVGLASSGTGNILAFSTINVGTLPVTATIIVTPHFTNAGKTCIGPGQTFSITVNPGGQVNLPPSQVLCNGDVATAVIFSTNNAGGTTTYTWTNTSSSIGLAASGTGNIPSFTVSNTGSAPVIATITVTPHFSGGGVNCNGSAQTFTITVNPTGQVNDPSDQVLCTGASTLPVVFITNNTGGTTTYTWVNSTTGIGLAASGSGDIPAFVATNAGSAPVVATIDVTPHFTNAGITCNGPTQNFTITVNPGGQVNDPPDQILCNGAMTAPVVFTTTNGGGTTYTWTNDHPSIGLSAAGNGDIGSFAAINPGGSPVIAIITVTPHFTSGGVSCAGPTQSLTITVNPTGQVNDPPDQILCNGDVTNPVLFTTSNTGGTTTYTWTNDHPSIGLASPGSGNIAAFTAVNAGSLPIVATIVVTPHFTSGGITCDGPVQTFTMTVNPGGQVNDPPDQVLCNGSQTAAVNFSTINTGGTTTYSWTNDHPAIGLPALGIGDIAAFTGTNPGTSPVIATIVVTPHYTNGGIACTGTSQSFTITVNPTGQVNDPADQVLCNGDQSAAVIYATVNTGGTTTYTWTNSNTVIGLASSGIGDISMFIATNPGTSPVVSSITVTPHFTNAGVTCDGPAQTFTLTVNPTGQVNDPPDQVLCNGDLTAVVIFTTNNTVGTTTYTWTNSSTSIGLASSGTGNILAFSAVNNGTLPVTATVVVTPHFTNAGKTCNGPSQFFTITVNPGGQVNLPPSQVLCNGDNAVAVIFSTNNTGGTTTYTWTNTSSGIGLAASGTGNIPAFTVTNTGTSPIIATIVVTPHFSGGGVNCPGPAQTFTITVNPTGQVADPADQVLCTGAMTIPVIFITNNTVGTTTYTWVNSTTGIGLAATGTGNIPAFAAVNAGSSPVLATVVVTPHYSNAGITCDGPSQTFTITVNPGGQVNDPPDQILCNGEMTAPVVFTTNNTGGTTYTWTNDHPSIGLAATGSGDISSFAVINPGGSPVIAIITVTPHYTSGGVTCAGLTQSFTITVNPTGQVNDPPDQILCNGDITNPVIFATSNTGGTTTYTWTNDHPSIGLASPGSGNIAAFTAINTGSSPVIATIVVTPHFTSGGITCDGPGQSFTITVNPGGQVNDPADQVLCNGNQTTAVTFSTINTGGTTTYSWTNDHPAIGLAALGNGDIAAFTATNPGTAPVIATIVVTPHYSNGGIVCNGPSQSFTITVNPTGQVNDPPDQVLCNGDQSAAVIFASVNTGGTTTYTWVNSNTSIGLASNGTGDISIFVVTNPGTSPVVGTVAVTPHFNNAGVTCDGPVQTFTITVNPTGQVNDPPDQVLCNGDLTAAVVFSTNNTAGTATYTWTNSNTTIGLASTGTGNILAFSAVNNGTLPVTATVVVTPHFTNAGKTCIGPTQSFTITVNPGGQVNLPPSQVLCNGDNAAAVIFSTNNTGGTTTYTWTNTGSSIGLAASGSGNIPAFPVTNTGTSPIVATIVVTPHFSGTGVNCPGQPQTFTITVNPTGQVTDPPDQVLCTGALTIPVIFITNNTGGTTTYTWVNSGTGIGLAATGTGNIPAFVVSNPGTTPVLATIVVTPHFSNAGITCDGPTQTFTITVNPGGQVNDPPDQILCNGGATTQVVFTTNNAGGTTYTWTNDHPSIGLPAFGNGDISSFTAINAGGSPVIAIITVTPQYTSGGVSCAGPTQSFTITVNPTAQVNNPVDQILCNGIVTAPVVFTTSNTGGTTTYTWTNDTPAIGLASPGSGNIPGFATINTGNSPIVATIVVTPHFTNGGITCDGPVKSFTMTVNPDGQVNDPPDQVLCNGNPTAAVNFSTVNIGGTTTYTWTNDHPSIGLASLGNGNIASFNAINPGFTPVIATIVVTPHFTNGGVPCTGPAQSFTITVNPTGQVSDPPDQVLCNGDQSAAVIFATINTGGTTTYTWTNSSTSIGLASGGTGDISMFIVTNPGTSPVVATIIVTPHFNNAGVTCDGPAQTFSITVNPTGEVNSVPDQVLCNGELTASVVFTTNNTAGTTTYSWTNSNNSIGLASSGTGNILAFNAVNNGTLPVTATIVVTPHYTNAGKTCVGPTQSFTITVNPGGQVNLPPSQVLCNGDISAAVVFSTNNTGGTTTFTWTNTSSSIGLAASGAGNIPAFTVVNTGSAPVIASIVVTPHFSGASVNCDGLTQTFTITVNPTGQVADPPDQVLCNGNLAVPIIFNTNNSGGTTTYTWVNSTTGIGLAATGAGNIPAFVVTNAGTSPVVATIVVTPHFTNAGTTCGGPSQTFTITVNPGGQVNDPSDQILCNGENTAPVVFTTNNTGGTTYTWTNDHPSIGLLPAGNGDIGSFTAINVGGSPVVAIITVTPHYSGGGVSCPGPTQSFTITVNPTGQVNDPVDQILCNGNVAAPVVFTTNNTGGTTTYTWTNDRPSIGLASPGSGNIPGFPVINNGISPIVATIVVTPHFTNGGITCDGPSQSFTMTVNPDAEVNDPPDQVLCNGNQTAAVIFSTTIVGGTTTYSWTNDHPSIGLASLGNGDIASFTAVNNGVSPVIATIVVKPHFSNAGITCDGPSQTFTITVNPTGQVNDPPDQVLCNGDQAAAVIFSTNNNGGTTTYSWTNTNTSIGLATSGNGDISAFFVTNPGTSPEVATIVVTPHFINAGLTCDGAAQTFTITVNPTGQVNNTPDQVLCNGDLTAAVVFSTVNTGGLTTYSWTNSAPGIGIPAAGTGNIIAFAAVNNGQSPVVATLVVTPHFINAGKTCIGPSQSFTITVNPTGQVDLPPSQVLCNGDIAAGVVFTTLNTGGITTYTWTNSAPGIGLPGSGSGNISAFTTVNAGTSPVVATIVVTPHFSNGGLICIGPAKTFTITVNPTGQVTDPADQVLCNGILTLPVVFITNNTGGTTSYTWTNSAPGIGLAANGGGNIPAFLANNPGTSPVVATIVVTPSFVNAGVTCSGPSQTFTITVNPGGQVNDPVDQAICHNAMTSAVVFTTVNTGGTTTYSWTNSATSIGLAATGTGSIPAFMANNPGTIPVIANIVVTPHFSGSGWTCDGPTQSFTITVNPLPTPVITGQLTVCENVSYVYTTEPGMSNYTWNISSGGTITSGGLP